MIQIFGNITELTSGRKLYDITPKIKDWINYENANTGLLTLNIKHTSASLLVNENYDSDVLLDIENFLKKFKTLRLHVGFEAVIEVLVVSWIDRNPIHSAQI